MLVRALIIAITSLSCLHATDSGVNRAGRHAWIEGKSAHFHYFSSSSKAELQAVARNLESLRHILAQTSPSVPIQANLGPRETYVYLFSQESLFNDYRYRKDIVGWFRASYSGNFMAMLTEQHGAQQIIYHEYMHQYLHERFPKIPQWLDEGLAEFYSTISFQGDDVRLGGPAEGRLRFMMALKPIPTEQLLAQSEIMAGHNPTLEAQQFYAQAWLMVHYLIAGGSPERNRQFMTMLGLLAQGSSGVEAFRMAFPIDPKVLDDEIRLYLHQICTKRVIPIRRISVHIPPTDLAENVAPMSPGEIQGRLGLLLQGSWNDELARAHFEEAFRLDPNCGPAWMGKANDLSFSDKRDAFLDALERAAKGCPGDPYPSWRAGSQLLKAYRPGSGSTSISEQCLRGRADLRQSLTIQPDQPETLQLVAKSYLGDTTHFEEGKAFIQQAIQRQPERLDLRYLLAMHYFMHLDNAAARPLFQELAQSPNVAYADLAKQALMELDNREANEEFKRAATHNAAHRSAEALPLLQHAQTLARDPELQARIKQALANLQAPSDPTPKATKPKHAKASRKTK